MDAMNEPVAFVVKQEDIPALFRAAGLTSNEGSAFYKAEAGGIKDTNLEDVYGELLADKDFLRAMRIVALPDLYVTARTAGVYGLSETRLHRKRAEGDWVVLTEKVEDEAILLTAFRNYDAYLDAWARDFAGTNDAPAANYIPPEIGLGEFLFILHAVDSFRRVSYQNMLDHVFVDRAYITIPEFTQSMARSLKNMDIRWLLPAFMAVTPGLGRYSADLNAKNLEVLLIHDFFKQGKTASGEDTLMFGEAGQVMGVEFFRSWLTSWGFEINVAEPGGFKAVERVFIAPTVLTNHYVRLQGPEEGAPTVNHQAYTAEQLMHKLDELFGGAFSMEATPAALQSDPESPPPASFTPTAFAPPTPESAAKPSDVPNQAKAEPVTTPEAPKFCRSCGTKLPAGAAFCANCGTRQNRDGSFVF